MMAQGFFAFIRALWTGHFKDSNENITEEKTGFSSSWGQAIEVQAGWMPQDLTVLDRWISKKVQQLDEKNEPFVEVIQKFQKFIESDTSILTLFQQMFTQVPTLAPYDRDTWGKPSVRDYMTMLRLFNSILTEPPEFTTKHASVAFPINAILSWPMGTPAGRAAFYLPSVNEHFRNILNARGEFLSSPESAVVLSDGPGGWLSQDALQAMGGFNDDFIHDVTQPHWGFKSWDDFFTRRFREGRRPVPTPYDSRIVVNPCEAGVYNVSRNVLEHDLFWLKENTYSLADMLDNHPFVPLFAGGTVYQGWLSALSYHRWHAPVSGTVVDIDFVPGTYYSPSPIVGMSSLALRNSQGYLTAVATRVNIYFQSDNPNIGLMCFMAVGMAEVSSCEVTVKKGDLVVQGQEIGMFHFGGSTSCLIFRPETNIQFKDVVQVGNMIKLNESIAFVNA
ncbi:hypothetical protein C0991_003592 [Blastosporella zonata]|nr:hypothetical protein C0991_003592 [Blastosporella zonata]